MENLIKNHFKKDDFKDRFYFITFTSYNTGPFAKNAKAFNERPISKVFDWCRKWCHSYIMVREYHKDGRPHVHVLATIRDHNMERKNFPKFKFGRGHIKCLKTNYEVSFPELLTLGWRPQAEIHEYNNPPAIIEFDEHKLAKAIGQPKPLVETLGHVARYMAKVPIAQPLLFEDYCCSCGRC